MGVTISYQLTTTRPYVKEILKRAELTAKKFQETAIKVSIPFEIRKLKTGLFIDIGGCETLAFEFVTPKQIYKEKERSGWSYLWATLTDDGKKEIDEGYKINQFPQNEKLYCSGFCKTQFCDNIVEHLWIAEIIRSIASYCELADISDEGDYYYSGKIESANNAIFENGKLIDSIFPTLVSVGWKLQDIQKGETKIQPFDVN